MDDVNVALATERPVEKVLTTIEVTSDRGLCGGGLITAILIKLTKQVIREKYRSQYEKGNVQILPIGKKGLQHEHSLKITLRVIDKLLGYFLSGLSFEKRYKHAAQYAMVKLKPTKNLTQ